MMVAVLGLGEVGRMYARAATPAHELLLSDPFPSPAAQGLADELATQLHPGPGPWLHQADQVWSCVTGDISRSAAADAAPFLRPDAVYVDLTTASPGDKLAGAQAVTERGTAYVDIAIMGAVALTGVQTPLLASGQSAAGVVAEFNALGAPARALQGSKPGDAVELKLLRTVLTKGLEALAVEAYVAAERKGLRHELKAVLSDIDERGFTPFLDAIVRTHLVHAARRSHEVERAIAELEAESLPADVLRGALACFEKDVAALQEDPPAENVSADIDRSVSWLLDSRSPAAVATGE